MAQPTVIASDLIVTGNFSAAGMTVPNGAIHDGQVAAPSSTYPPIASSKIMGARTAAAQLFGPTTTITALTESVTCIVGSTGDLIDFSAWITTAATGSDRTVTVDLQKSTGGGGFATVLSATIGFTHSSTPLTLTSGALSATGVVAGDLLQVVVTVAGSASAQALGLTVALRYDESYV